jgi:hypothetical protein
VKRHTIRGEVHLEKGRTSKEKGRTSKEEQAHKSKQEDSQEGGVLIPRRVHTSRRIFTIKLEIYCCCKPLRGERTSFVQGDMYLLCTYAIKQWQVSQNSVKYCKENEMLCYEQKNIVK